MGQALCLEDNFSRQDVEKIRRQFLAIHRERLRRILEEIPQGQHDFFQLLPLLFHINHPLLPGFINTETPAGIPDYHPPQAALHLVQKLSRSFRYKRLRMAQTPIEGIYLVGCAGTLGQTSHEKYDICLFHSAELTDQALSDLQQKAEKIQAWAKTLHMQVDIHTIPVDTFQTNESRTQTQQAAYQFQLEDFYRTGLYFAGRTPLWWLVPPEQEANYVSFTEELLDKQLVNQQDYLDFGGLDAIPAKVLFDLAYQALCSSIDLPYKSLLNVLLIETYIKDFPHPNWLAIQSKKCIYDGETTLAKLDSSTLLYQHIEHHLQQDENTHRLELAQRCLYFKTGAALSHKSRPGWRTDDITTLVEDWAWDKAQLVHMDARSNWKINQVIEERNTLVHELSYGYRVLTEFAQVHNIDPVKLSLLGRHLYTSIEHRPGKIDSINPGISQHLKEAHLSLHCLDTKNAEEEGWLLYRGHVDLEQAEETSPLKATHSLLETLAWCHINKIAEYDTVFHLYPEDQNVSFSEIQAISRILEKTLEADIYQKPELNNLRHSAHTLASLLFINIGVDPMASLSKEGKQLTSNRSDPLSFGSAHLSLIENIEQLSYTSWGEVIVQRRNGTSGLLDTLCELINTTVDNCLTDTPAEIQAYCFSSVKGPQIAQRIHDLIINICQSVALNENGRHVGMIGDGYYIIQKGDKGYYWLPLETQEDLKDELQRPCYNFSPVILDQNVLEGSVFPSLYPLNKKGRIEFFFLVNKNSVDTYMLDENGSLHVQHYPDASIHYILQHQQRFVASLLHQNSLINPSDNTQPPSQEPEYYQLRRNRNGGWLAEYLKPPKHVSTNLYVEVKLVAQDPTDPMAPYTLACGDQEFSSLEHGRETYAKAALYIQSMRKTKERYPIYITAIQYNASQQGTPATSVELFNLKQRVEQRLNHAMKTQSH